MSFRPYIAAFLIAAILNPFCCCFGKPGKAERVANVSELAACPHCPRPGNRDSTPSEEPACPCTSQKEFADSKEPITILAAEVGTAPAAEWQLTGAPLPEKNHAVVVAIPPTPDPTGCPPVYVRFCTYLL